MDDRERDEPREPLQRPPAEGVRIIGAEEAAAAVEGGGAAARRPAGADSSDEPRIRRFPTPQRDSEFGDDPVPPGGPRASADDAGGTTTRLPTGPAPDLPHWTDPPTGEVPRILVTDEPAQEDDLGAWQTFTANAPRWRDQHDDWSGADFDDAAMLADDEVRIGAMDLDRPSPEADPFAVDDPVEPRRPTPIRTGPGARPPAEPRRARPEPPATPGRPAGGRNVGAAVGTGLAVAVAALVCFSIGPAATLVLAVAVVTFCAVEVYDVLRRAGYRPATLLGLTATVSIMFAAYAKGETAIPLVLAMATIFCFLWYLGGVTRARPTVNMAVTMFAFLWIGGLGSFAALLLALPRREGIAFLLGAVVCTVAADVGAFVVGRQFGSRALAPAISPNKTWEGLVGGTFFAVVAALLVVQHVSPWTTSGAFWMAVVASTVGPVGDLAESMVKRDIGIKDMGSILPGHGGVLDRFDALLFVLPATYYLVRLLDLA